MIFLYENIAVVWVNTDCDAQPARRYCVYNKPIWRVYADMHNRTYTRRSGQEYWESTSPGVRVSAAVSGRDDDGDSVTVASRGIG